MSDVRALGGFAAPHVRGLALGAVLMLCESAAALMVPWIGGMLAGALLPGGDATADVSSVLWAMTGIFVVQAALRFGSSLVLEGVLDHIVADLKIRLYDHLQALPMRFYHQRRLGDTLALLTTDVYVVGGFITGTAVAVVPLVVTAAGAAFLMFRIRPDLALLALFAIPLFYLAMKVIGRQLRPLAMRLQDEEANAIALAQENLGMLPAIKTFTREPHESARYRAQIDRILRISAQQRRIQAALGPIVQLVAAIAIVLVFALASGDMIEGRLTPAQLVTFLLYAQLLTRPVSGLADVYGRLQGARGALERLKKAIAEPPEVPGSQPLARIKGEIHLHGVSFAYENRAPALRNVDLHIAAGETVALVGPNGAGKSTLAHLLMRLHDPTQGRITIDGVDIATVSLESLRRQIGIVPQHVLLFNASVLENIAYGRADAGAAAIETAARAAQAHDFIIELPQAYDTLVGDRGVRLSGGQQQRLALARALLKDPPLLILDEATSMFDPEGESDFLRVCRPVFRGRTVILITHRPASLAVADRILRFDGGRLVPG